MPDIHAAIVIDAPVERVYALAKDIERLPEFLPNVERVTITSRDGNHVVSEWIGLVPEFKRKLAWIEEDVWDDDARRCVFTFISGDWDKYDGIWAFTPLEKGTQVTLDISYEYNVPLIGALIKKLLHKLMQRSADETLQGLRQMAAAGS